VQVDFKREIAYSGQKLRIYIQSQCTDLKCQGPYPGKLAAKSLQTALYQMTHLRTVNSTVKLILL